MSGTPRTSTATSNARSAPSKFRSCTCLPKPISTSPLGDARYESAFIPGVTFTPIPSLWGHTAGAASNPADAKFLNENIGRFLAAQ